MNMVLSIFVLCVAVCGVVAPPPGSETSNYNLGLNADHQEEGGKTTNTFQADITGDNANSGKTETVSIVNENQDRPNIVDGKFGTPDKLVVTQYNAENENGEIKSNAVTTRNGNGKGFGFQMKGAVGHRNQVQGGVFGAGAQYKTSNPQQTTLIGKHTSVVGAETIGHQQNALLLNDGAKTVNVERTKANGQGEKTSALKFGQDVQGNADWNMNADSSNYQSKNKQS